MSKSAVSSRVDIQPRERGMALIAALLLLLVMTIMAIGMFRSFGLQEKISGNTREKQRSLHAAESAQAYAEWWLTSNNGVNTLNTPVDCSKTNQASVDKGLTQICDKAPVDPSDLTAWANKGNTYTPPGLQVGTGGVDTYYQIPIFNISYLYSQPFNNQTKTQTSFYQVDALGYGGTSGATSVVESMYEVNLTYGGSRSHTHGRYVDLGGP